MEAFKAFIAIDRHGEASVFAQVSKGIVRIIQRGLLQPGERLPSVRSLARLLDVHPKTIVAAYSDLESQRWIQPIPRKGVYVSKVLPVIKPIRFLPKLDDRNAGIKKPVGEPDITLVARGASTTSLIVDDGFPDHRLAPVDSIVREYRRLITMNHAIRNSTYPEYTGAESFRISLCKFLRDTRALPITESNLLITRGAQMALYLICRKFLKKGARVVVGEPNYPFANEIFKECGAKLLPVAVEKDGIDVSKISQICKKRRPDLLYILPHHHHPTTVTLSPQKRIALLELIERYKLMVIEDDYDYDFNYDSSPILPLASYVKGQSIFYVGSLSKAISNSLRIGFVCASTSAIDEMGRLRKLIDLRGDAFLELALGAFIRDGDYARHLKRTNKIYKERRDLMLQSIRENFPGVIRVDKPIGGMALWAEFDKSIDLQSLALKVRRKGLYLSDGTFYNTGTRNLNATRIGFASKNEAEIHEIMRILKRSVERKH